MKLSIETDLSLLLGVILVLVSEISLPRPDIEDRREYFPLSFTPITCKLAVPPHTYICNNCQYPMTRKAG